jgi:glycosyltransferase involved in cell wall biosynthesis
MGQIDISIIVATCNRPEILRQSLQKAIDAMEGLQAEIIVVNDGYKTRLLPAPIEHKIRYFINTGKGVSAARNLGASNALGSVFLFLDDDMWVSREAMEWINSHVVGKQDLNSVFNLNWQYPPTLMEKLASSSLGQFLLDTRYYCMWGRMHEPGVQPIQGLHKGMHVGSGSLVMQAVIFRRIKGYNEQLMFQGEDIDLSERLNALDISIYNVFDVTLYHNHQDRLEITDYLRRLSAGYKSEFEAVKKGIIKPRTKKEYPGLRKLAYPMLSKLEPLLVFTLRKLPNRKMLRPLNNRVIGLLSGLQRYKQWASVQKIL